MSGRECYEDEEMRQVLIQEEGQAAYYAGQERRESPYPVLSAEWENWIEGWVRSANKDNEKRSQKACIGKQNWYNGNRKHNNGEHKMQAVTISSLLTTSLYELEVIQYPYGYTLALRRRDSNQRQELDTKRGERRIFKTAEAAIKEAKRLGVDSVKVIFQSGSTKSDA